MKPGAVALLSGGLDSTTALWKIKGDYSNITTLTFSYGAKDEEVSLEITEKLSKIIGANHRIVTLPWLAAFSRISGSSLVVHGEVPKPMEQDLDDIKTARETARSVWVPARNLIFLSIAISFAEAMGGNLDLIVGFDKEEAESFPDNSIDFLNQMNRVIETAVLKKNITILAPLIYMSKAEIAKLALNLGVPIEFTSSCYTPMGLDDVGRPIHCE
jgi:7-cyano-7-deazaguanine synthase